ncbi:VWA domain-containing protein [uncultured Tenacibaculum sp.]|uniref:VWA domain-containing protein n=1 Tax=uncultured Tenacibaculum sp. TaxID=174713 RepID=UPI00261C2508|nr:VWA domain-containing protein [uncultured Tenacibaculum sp.]
MQIETIVYIILALLVSLGIGFFQYFFRVKTTPKITIVLFFLRVLSIFLILLLLINPKIELTTTNDVKPSLSVLVDNSSSTKFFKEDQFVNSFIQEVNDNKALNDKFDVGFYAFGENVAQLDSLNFSGQKTNITKAIKSVNELQKDKEGTLVLLSDGNQTLGEDYEFLKSKKSIHSLVLGDTIQYQDIKISQLNVNKYSYLNNKFPVEAFINYEGRKSVNAVFSIFKSRRKIFSKKIELSPNKKSATITAELDSDKEGVHYYSATVSKLEGEKNTRNNSKNFTIEVIDEQSKVLVLSSILHPDLGVFKKSIESNKQRKVEIAQINAFKGSLEDYQFVIFYQPNAYFRSFLQDRKSNFLIVTGTKTDWNFLNSLGYDFNKAAISQSENYRPVYNTNFLTYLQDDIGFDGFPPLRDKFGSIAVKGNSDLLFQQLKGINTTNPLLSTFESGGNKFAVLFGEGIWKWRAASFIKENSFEVFDEFLGNLVQYLNSNKKRRRLDVKLDNLYLANEKIAVSALYLDKNYRFDSRASLEIVVKNEETKAQKVYPFSLINNSYKVSIEGLDSGDYTYRVSVLGQNVFKSGKFKVADFQIEQQFSNANYKKLGVLAKNTNGALFYKDQKEDLVISLLENEKFFTIQKLEKKDQDLINWKWILFIVVLLLATEWFTRKFFGKI